MAHKTKARWVGTVQIDVEISEADFGSEYADLASRLHDCFMQGNFTQEVKDRLSIEDPETCISSGETISVTQQYADCWGIPQEETK